METMGLALFPTNCSVIAISGVWLDIGVRGSAHLSGYRRSEGLSAFPFLKTATMPMSSEADHSPFFALCSILFLHQLIASVV